MQKPAGIQIDERVDARFNSKIDSTIPVTVRNILVDNFNPTSFKKNGSRKHKKKHGSKAGNKKHNSGQLQQVVQHFTFSVCSTYSQWDFK